MRRIDLAFIGLALITLPTPADEPAIHPPFRVAAYLPDYRMAGFDPASARGATDLIVFSASPKAGGTLDLSRLTATPWPRLLALKTRERVRLILTVGGWGRSGGFATIAASAELRAKFAKEAVDVCLARRLDGLDLDWEHPKDAKEADGYARLLADMRNTFTPHGLTLSVTVAAWQTLPKETFAAVDWVHIMAYDHEGRHATPESAEADVKTLIDRGAPREKLVLGLPFYGRDLKNHDRAVTYAEIVAKSHPNPEVDEVDGLYFNGPETIRRKTRLALDGKLGGVMVWEIGQDANGTASLLRVIRGEIDRR